MRTGRIQQGYGIIQRDIMTSDISIYSKAVYCLLVSYAGNKDSCFPSLKTMCDNLKISKNTVIKSLKELIQHKLIIADRRKTKEGDYASNVYYPMYVLDYDVVHQVNEGSSSDELRVVHDVNTKNNNIKNNIEEEKNTVGETPTLFNDSIKQPEAKEEKKEEPAREKSFDERAGLFVEAFNKVVDRKYKATTKVKQALKQRIKSYTAADILKAVKAASKHQFHIDNNFQYLTPAYILREDILERYLNAPTATAAQSTSTEIVLQ